MSGQSEMTTNHDQIQRWIEERGGEPAVVASTHKKKNSGMLRVDFPGYSGEGSLEKIDWDEFFAIFDERKLGFLYQDETSAGQKSRFFKFVEAHH